MDILFKKLKKLAEKYQDKRDREENGGTNYVMHDLEVDFQELSHYGKLKPFLWIVRKTGTHICLLIDKEADYILRRVNIWMYYGSSKNSGAHFFYYDGYKIKEITLADSIAVMAFQLGAIINKNRIESLEGNLAEID